MNLYKLAAAALDARPGRRVIVTDDDNFPTDRYVLEGLAAARGLELRLVPTDIDDGLDPERLAAALDDDVALVSLSHLAYRSGARRRHGRHHRGRARGRRARCCGTCATRPVRCRRRCTSPGADLAVGCTYKYLNGGPGAPAFLFVRADLQPALRQPIWGWFGQRDQFAMGAGYDPVESIERFLVGTPPVLGAVRRARRGPHHRRGRRPGARRQGGRAHPVRDRTERRVARRLLGCGWPRRAIRPGAART